MSETNKYYTPSIEEFHVGFEYEWIGTDGFSLALRLKDIEEHFLSVPRMLEEKLLRVKYLDQEDIESFGFIEDKEAKEEYPIDTDGLYFGKVSIPPVTPTKIHYCIKFHIRSRSVHLFCIEERPHSGIQYPVFRGIVKNKSELKRILKQIGYENSI
jgi:hypothetical protein